MLSQKFLVEPNQLQFNMTEPSLKEVQPEHTHQTNRPNSTKQIGLSPIQLKQMGLGPNQQINGPESKLITQIFVFSSAALSNKFTLGNPCQKITQRI